MYEAVHTHACVCVCVCVRVCMCMHIYALNMRETVGVLAYMCANATYQYMYTFFSC